MRPAIPNLFVTDMAAALAYYTGPLGFGVLFTYGTPPYYAHVARGEAVLAIRHVDRPVIDHAVGEDLLSAFIETTDVDGHHAAMHSAGAAIHQAPRDEPWGMRSLIVSDPDGNLVMFAQPL